MRVIFVETPRAYGGSMQSLLELCCYLPADVEPVLVCTYDIEKQKPVPEKVRLVKVTAPPKGLGKTRVSRLLRSEIWWYRVLKPVLRRYRPSVVHFNHSVTYCLGGVVGTWLHRIPCIVHAREYVYSARLYKMFAHLPRFHIAISRSVAEDLLRHRVPSKRLRVIYNPVSPPEESIAATTNEHGTSVIRIGMLGVIKPRKGQHVFLKALGILQQSQIPFVGMIAGMPAPGAEEYYSSLQDIVATLGLRDSVVFVGFVQNPYDFLRQVDIAVHANTRPEPLGRTVVEAMLARRAVIATDGGGIPEFVEHGRTGLLVPMDDENAMAQALLVLARDRALRTRLGEAAYDKARWMFDPEKHVAEVLKVYQEMLR